MKKYYKFELDIIIANILALVLMVGVFVLYVFYKKTLSIQYPGIYLILMLFYFLLHEVFHGIGYSLYVKNKKNIKYGCVLEKGVFYAMCQEKISKSAILVSLALPLIFLTGLVGILGLIFNNDLMCLLAIINLAGAAGDLLMMLFIVKLPKDIKYIDYDNVIGCYFVSDKDLSKYKGFGIKFVESGEDKKELVNTSIPRIYVSKKSIPTLLVFIALAVVMIFMDFK